MLFYFIVGCFTTAFMSFIYAVFVFLKGPRQKVNILCSAMALSVALWSLGLVLMATAKNSTEAVFYLKYIHYLGAIFIAPFFLHFTLTLLKLEKRHFLIILINYILAGILEVANFSGALATVAVKDIFNYYTEPRIFYYLFTLVFTVDVILAHYFLFVEYKKSSGGRKEQIKYLLVGLFIGFCGGSTAFPLVFNINIFPFGVPLVIAYVLSATYAIIKYRLMDIRVVASRAVLFTFVYMPILALPFLITYWNKNLLIKIMGQSYWIVPTILEGTLAVIGLSIYIRLQSQAERHLLYEEYRARELINKISSEVVHIHELSEAAKLIAEDCFKAIPMEHIAVYVLNRVTRIYQLVSYAGSGKTLKKIKEENIIIETLLRKHRIINAEYISSNDKSLIKQIKAMKAAVVVGIFRDKELLGIIVLGAKNNGKLYTPLEFEALKTLANQTALVIENIQTFDERQKLQFQIIENKRMVELGHLACAMGHQLNNNVNIITLAAQMLQMDKKVWELVDKDSESSARLKEYLADMIDQGKDCRSILEELGSYAQKETKEDLQGYVELVPVLKRALKLTRLRNPKFDQIKLEKEMIKDPAVVQGSFLQLQNVMVNILNNSFDAIVLEASQSEDKDYKGYIKITLADAGDFYHIHFIDNGIGMREQTKEKVFKIPMFTTKTSGAKREARQNKKDTDITGGTGIGSYTIRMIVSNHGGEVSVYYSQPHKVTDILLKLPKKVWNVEQKKSKAG